jgi:hypothetical protein
MEESIDVCLKSGEPLLKMKPESSQ